MFDKQKLTKIVGSANVTYESTELENYSRDISFVNAIRPLCIVKPQKATDIQQIIKLANKTQTALVPVSSGTPHFRGDTVPSTGGAVIVDLSKMNKVIFVDRPRRVAMVEPGVTFGELIPEAKKEGLRLNMPFLPRKTKSVLGSILEREPVTMPKYQWDVSDPLACAGLYFGTGDEFRTGQAAGPGTIKQQWEVGGVQKAPYGPGTGSWHRLIQGAQGTLGIVTWVSMRCELLPSIEEPFVVGTSDLDSLIRLTSRLIRLRIVNECFILNRTNLATIFSKKYGRDYQSLKNTLPAWTLFFTIAGYEYFPMDRISAYKKEISDITQQLGLDIAKATGLVSANAIAKTVQQPCAEPYWKLRPKGACQDIFFLTIYKKLGSQIAAMQDMAEKSGYPVSDLGVYIQPIVQGTGYHCEFNLFYDSESPAESNRVKTLSTSATKCLMDKGAFFSRPYGEEANPILNKDAATVAVLQKFKKIFDPNNVMNPGKVCF